jgi:hypothetical protein
MNNTTRAVFRIVINGKIESVWRELTKQGEPQAAVFNAWLHAQAMEIGKKMQMPTRAARTSWWWVRSRRLILPRVSHTHASSPNWTTPSAR